jgi:hypothetical protein
MLGTTPGITPTESITEIINFINQNFFNITTSKVFLDVGSGKGNVVNDFKRLTNINRSIGVEMQDYFYKKSIEKYPSLEFYHATIQEKPEILNIADIIFTNNICFPSETFWNILANAKPGALIIYNGIGETAKLVKHGYDRKKILKKTVVSNNMSSEFHFVKKI